MSYTETTGWDRVSVRRRGVGIAIALAFEALLIIAILSLGMRSGDPVSRESRLTTFSLEAESSSARKSATDTAAPSVATERNIVPQIPKPLLPPVNPVSTPPPSPDYIKVSKADFEAMDLSKIPSNGSGSGAGEAKGAGEGDKDFIGPSRGPGGARLYPVAWYREPTDAELAPYLTNAKFPPGASAEIACRMIENYHVENCQILGETPRGTGLAKALRLAAWQFLVRPPRIDNKPQLGVWVRIRFDFRSKAEEATP